MKNIYTLYWRTGDRETVQGADVAQAMTLAGYGGGAVGALDFYANGDDHAYEWDASKCDWVRKLRQDVVSTPDVERDTHTRACGAGGKTVNMERKLVLWEGPPSMEIAIIECRAERDLSLPAAFCAAVAYWQDNYPQGKAWAREAAKSGEPFSIGRLIDDDMLNDPGLTEAMNGQGMWDIHITLAHGGVDSTLPWSTPLTPEERSIETDGPGVGP